MTLWGIRPLRENRPLKSVGVPVDSDSGEFATSGCPEVVRKYEHRTVQISQGAIGGTVYRFACRIRVASPARSRQSPDAIRTRRLGNLGGASAGLCIGHRANARRLPVVRYRGRPCALRWGTLHGL